MLSLSRHLQRPVRRIALTPAPPLQRVRCIAMSTNRESDEVIFALHSRTATFLAATVLLQQSIGIAIAGSLPTGLISMGLFIGQLVTLLIYERNTNRQKGSTLRALCLATPSLLQAALWVVAADTWWHALIACLFGSVVFICLRHSRGRLPPLGRQPSDSAPRHQNARVAIPRDHRRLQGGHLVSLQCRAALPHTCAAYLDDRDEAARDPFQRLHGEDDQPSSSKRRARPCLGVNQRQVASGLWPKS